jgi:hypothetical protein
MEYTQPTTDKTEFTIAEFAEFNGITLDGVYKMLQRDQLPNEFQLVQLSSRKRVIVKKQIENPDAPLYKHASEIDHLTLIEINKCLSDTTFLKKNGKPNIKKIAEQVNEHYWTIKRFVDGNFKKKNDNRADKNKSRKLSAEQIKIAKPAFEKLYLRNVQGNTKLTIEKVQWNVGVQIPQRLAYKWAKALRGVHQQKHYFQKFTSRNTPHVIRDLWTEYDNFLDCVVADEWKIDEFGVWVHSLSNEYDKVKAMAYIVMFIDMKTRYPLSTLITPHSTTSADSKKAAMQLVRDWGRPKKWLFENQKTWKNADFLRFIFGIYDEEVVYAGRTRIEFMDLSDLKVVEQVNDQVTRSKVCHPESKPIERIFRIIKDEFCAYAESYSPNQFESRKPNLGDAHPGVTRTFKQLRNDLTGFMQHDFLDRERMMFHNRMLSTAHKINKARPKTIRDVFELAYQSYEPDKIDAWDLAYHYADKYKKKFTGGTISFVYKPSLEKLNFVPLEVDKVMDYTGQELVALIDQYNVYHAWIFNLDGELLCEASDMRQFGAKSKEQANELGKLTRKITTLNKQKAKSLEQLKKLQNIKTFQYEKTMETPEKESSEYLDDDYSGDLIEFSEVVESSDDDSNDDFLDTSIIEF